MRVLRLALLLVLIAGALYAFGTPTLWVKPKCVDGRYEVLHRSTEPVRYAKC